MVMASEEKLNWPPKLATFGDRLTFLRCSILRYQTSAKAFAERCGFKPPTYQTWEHGTRPDNRDEIAARITEEFHLPGDCRDWLLYGGDIILFTYSDLCAVEEHQLRLPFDLPRSVQNAVLSVAS